MKHIPNILTITRFFFIPFIIKYALEDNYIAVMIVLTLSSITDVLDGFIARKFNFITDFGRLIDPLADKCTQVSLLISLCIRGIIPLWIAIIVTVKEILSITGATIIYKKKLVTSSKWFGKLATVLFYVAIISSMIIRQFKLNYTFDIYIYYIAVGVTVFALAMYFRMYLTHKFVPSTNNLTEIKEAHD